MIVGCDLTLAEGTLKLRPVFRLSEARQTSDFMKIALPLTAVLFTGWIVSCTPAPEEAPPTPPTDVAANPGAAAQDSLSEQKKKVDDTTSQADEMKTKEDEEKEKISETVEDPKPSKPETKAAVPVARRVPGRDGFVFSPYNNKMINVKDFASGTMVADPTYPPAEKKYFRVP